MKGIERDREDKERDREVIEQDRVWIDRCYLMGDVC